MKPLHRNVLLDRDGTVVEECHYLCDPDQVRLTSGAGPALAGLARAGCRLFLVTNQSGLGRGYFTQGQYQSVQDRLADLLRPHGAVLTATVMCPHSPDAGCLCRKPLPGLWEELRQQHALAAAQSVMVGDKAADIEFARSCGLATSILVLTGHGQQAAAEMGLPALRHDCLELPGHESNWPDVLARDLAAASRWILKTGSNR